MIKRNIHGWITEHIKYKRKNDSYDRQKRESSDENRADYMKALIIVTREARRSTEKFRRKMAENDLKSLWNNTN